LTVKFPQEIFVMKRSLFLMAALGLLASLAFGTPSQASTISFTYSTALVPSTPNPAVITGVFIPTPGGTPNSTPPGPTTLTVSPFHVATTQTGPIVPPAAGPGAPYSFVIGDFSLQHLDAHGVYLLSGTVTENVTINIAGPGGGSGSFKVDENFFGFVGMGATTITPSITAEPPGYTYIGKYRVSVFYEATSTQTGVPGSAMSIAIEATTVPEPTSMALLGIGMTSFLAFRRFFKRSVTV
jgi:hypothetical protein